MLQVFGRTGPPISGGGGCCQFLHPLFSVTYLFFLHLINDDVINSSLTAICRVQTPVKHTSLHNRFGVLKCSKTHLQQTRISKNFRGTNPRAPATGPALEHNEQGRQLLNADADSGPEYRLGVLRMSSSDLVMFWCLTSVQKMALLALSKSTATALPTSTSHVTT